MECRICHQPISFIKGTRPGQSRKATVAVHEHDLSRVLTEIHGEVVNPHPGNQRKLRQELENTHRQGQVATRETPHTDVAPGEAKPADMPIPKSEIPGAEVINHPSGASGASGASGPTGEQTDEHHDAQRSASN